MVKQETEITFAIRAKSSGGYPCILTQERFIEVETPMMHVIPGGASARPL